MAIANTTTLPTLPKKPGQDDGSMTVTTMDGPAASVPKPADSPAGPQLQPTVPTPTPIPFGPTQTPLVDPASTAPTAVAPAPAQVPAGGATPAPTGAGAYDRPGGTFTPQDPNVVTAGAANNPVGNAAFQWVADPVTGAFVKKGTEMKIGADGMVTDAQGNPVDMPGSRHTQFFDGGTATGTAPAESFQRAGVDGKMGATEWAGGKAPQPGEFGYDPATAGAAGSQPQDAAARIAQLIQQGNGAQLSAANVAKAPAPLPFGPPNTMPASAAPSIGGAVAPAGNAAAAPAGASAAGGAPGVSTTPITGNETPYSVDPTQSAALSSLLQRAQAAVTQGLDAPTAWDDPLAAGVKDAARRGIDNNYDDADQSLSAELAQRGLSYSDIASKRFLDLKSQKANALTDLDTNIATQRANSLASGRSAALNAAMNAIGMNANLESSARGEQRTERGYVDSLNDKAKQDALTQTVLGQQYGQQNFNNILQLIQSGLGYGSSGISALTNAGSQYGNASGEYGQQADAGSSQMADLAALAMRLFGGGK